MKREKGYYWVLGKSWNQGGYVWKIAFWNSEVWLLNGEIAYEDSVWKKINETRILSPDEKT